MTDDDPFNHRMKRLEFLLGQVEKIPDPDQRNRVGDIIQNLMEFYGAGLKAIARQLERAGPPGQAILADLSKDPLIGALFALHDMHPRSLLARVESALETVRPYLASHGGNVQLLAVTDQAVVRLQLQGSCHGCPSSAATMKQAVEKAIYEQAPDAAAIELVGEAPPAAPHPEPTAFVPLEQLTRNHRQTMQGVLS